MQSEDPRTTDADSDTSSVEGDAQKVRLSFIDGQQPKPTRLLRIPHDILITLSTKPRKWLRYAAYVICGIDGTLQSYNEHQELVDAELDDVVNEGDHFVYHFTGGADFVDRWARDRRRSQPSVSIRSDDTLNTLKDYYGGCPFTHVPLSVCQCCHLISHSTYLQAVLRVRGDSDEDMDIDDPGNRIVLYSGLHAYFDNAKSIAFLATPNAFLKSNDLPGNETEDPDKYLVTLHAFMHLPPVHVPHGRSSDMTQNSGLKYPPPERHINKNNLPRNTLLDVCYAVALLEQWGSERVKLILDKSARKYYPGGGVRRGEDREGELRREERTRECVIDCHDKNRSAGGHLTERNDRILDSLRWAPYIFRRISPEEVQARREEERKKAEREEAERIGRWQEEVYEQSSADAAGYGEGV